MINRLFFQYYCCKEVTFYQFSTLTKYRLLKLGYSPAISIPYHSVNCLSYANSRQTVCSLYRDIEDVPF
jgi:hypothetical protein